MPSNVITYFCDIKRVLIGSFCIRDFDSLYDSRFFHNKRSDLLSIVSVFWTLIGYKIRAFFYIMLIYRKPKIKSISKWCRYKTGREAEAVFKRCVLVMKKSIGMSIAMAEVLTKKLKNRKYITNNIIPNPGIYYTLYSQSLDFIGNN